MNISQKYLNCKENALSRNSTLLAKWLICYAKESKYDEALVIYEEVFNIYERVLGAEHSSTLTTRRNMVLV